MKTNESLYKMNNIKLLNYRCFNEMPIEFSEKITLLIGDNASGKTTIISAVSSVLTTFFNGFSDKNTRFKGLSERDFRIEEAEHSLMNENPVKVDFTLLNISASLERISKKGRTLQGPLKPIRDLAHEIYKNMFLDGKQVIALPLFASFSTSDIHASRKLSLEPFKNYNQKPSFGYFECMQGDGLLNYWTKRLLVLREANTSELEINGVISALMAALGPDGCHVITDVHIRPIQGKVYYYLNDNRLSDTENLSDGLRRLINIVVDLSFRCMLLNKGFYGAEACKKTTGTVLIDEIDLHLHPTLQSVVMKGLQNAFPLIQFIITSHAPMVMTGIPMDDKNKIIRLGFSKNEGYYAKEIETYGLDASTIIQAILGVTPRSQEVENRLQTLFGFIDNDEYEKALEKLKQMRLEFGDNLPELSKAESMLNFLTSKDDSDK